MSYTCTVKKGNLLDEKNATFIVNASNTQMLLGSGVSAAFRRRCGSTLQKEMFDKLRSLGHALQQGDVVATSSGESVNFLYALHAAVMDYNEGVRGDGTLPKLQDIDNILINIESYLKHYAAHHPGETIKLVLPLMGCGVGGLDRRKVLETYRNFFRRDVPFDSEVVVYGHNSEDYRLAKEICLGEEM